MGYQWLPWELGVIWLPRVSREGNRVPAPAPAPVHLTQTKNRYSDTSVIFFDDFCAIQIISFDKKFGTGLSPSRWANFLMGTNFLYPAGFVALNMFGHDHWALTRNRGMILIRNKLFLGGRVFRVPQQNPSELS